MMEVTVDVPFGNVRHAEIAYKTLSVDPEPKRSLMVKRLTLDGATLHATFSCHEPTTMRVSVGAFFELLALTLKTIDRFDALVD